MELQVLMPVVNAPFRIYWAYNPTRFAGNLQAPVVFDRSLFPNDISYNAALLLYGRPQPFREKRSTFRFSIGRTF